MTTTQTTQGFEVGRSYYTRSICDHNCIFSIEVSRRTAKTLTTSEGKRLRIGRCTDGTEFVLPEGNYSMAPMICADDTERPLTDWDKH